MPLAAPPQEEDLTELLGSLTTEQQQRTSARVIKKLRLEPQPQKRSDAEELKFPTVKQRMPKALWSTDEKSLFFEALNEYGKDFDALTSYICAKMKKKGMPDSNLKTKTQLYALINYGELRKKLVSVNEKTCGRLGEMVLGGSMVVRARGRNLRVRTPMCRALRRLNQITGRGHAPGAGDVKTSGRLGEMVLGGSMVVRARGRNLRVRMPMCRALCRLNQITGRGHAAGAGGVKTCGWLGEMVLGGNMVVRARGRNLRKKFKTEETEAKLINIEETAIDGIELMANYKNLIEDERPSTEDEIKAEETAEEETERDKDMSEREKDSFSEMEDDEKYNKSDTDNESDGKSGKERKFKNLKVKFRIRQKKRGGSVYTLVMDDAKADCKEEKPDIDKPDMEKPDLEKPDVEKPDIEKPDIDVELALRQIRRGWSFGNRSKVELDYWWAEPQPPLPQLLKPMLELDKDGVRERLKAEKDRDFSVEDGARESYADIFSPKMCGQDSNDGMSADERKHDNEPKSEVLDVDDDVTEDATTLNDTSRQPGDEPGGFRGPDETKRETDIGSFLPSESMSLSPSRLLRDSEWLDGSVQDFSLSSFLGHLEARAPPDLASMSLSPSWLLRDSEWLDGSVQDFSLSSFLGHLEARAPPDLASMSLSPSRLLRNSEWLDGSVQDFGLSSFLGHLEARAQPDLAVRPTLHSTLIVHVSVSVAAAARLGDLKNDVPEDYGREKPLGTRFSNFSTRPSGPQRAPFVSARGK
ncbi:Protein cramped, partial [Operophtera brumata]